MDSAGQSTLLPSETVPSWSDTTGRTVPWLNQYPPDSQRSGKFRCWPSGAHGCFDIRYPVDVAPPPGLLETHIAEPSFSTSAPPKMHAQQNPHSALKLRAEPGIMLLWCDIFAVLSATITRTGPQGVGSTLRPAAFVFPGLFYSITEKIAIALSSKFGGNRYLYSCRHIPALLIFLKAFLDFYEFISACCYTHPYI